MEPSTRPDLRGILAGSEEPVFRVLPNTVLDNLRRIESESSVLWNLIYPRAQPSLSLADLLGLKPLWGSKLTLADDALEPYYWGYNSSGDRLHGLDQALDRIDGSGPQTEVDLFMLGNRELVLVEAKHMSGLGRCSRFMSGRCPEIQDVGRDPCRYWHVETASFSESLRLGKSPTPHSDAPPCNRHYQLARTLLIGQVLAGLLQRRLHLWLLTPRVRWLNLERDWIDFTERVVDHDLWRRMRVIAWEQIQTLKP